VDIKVNKAVIRCKEKELGPSERIQVNRKQEEKGPSANP
jgi:hypothetical protein